MRYTIVIDLDEEEAEWLKEARNDVRQALKHQHTVCLQDEATDEHLITGTLVDLRPSRSKVDSKGGYTERHGQQQ